MTDLKIVDNAFDSVGSAGEAALDTIVGGAAMAVDAATRPRRTTGRARRRGSDVNEAIAEAAEEVIDTATGIPERMLIAYLRGMRRQARRGDVVGATARVVLGAVHARAREAARFFGRVERETQVTRTGARRTTTSSRRTATGTRRTATGTRGGRTTTTRGRTSGTTARRATGTTARRTSGTTSRRTGTRRTTGRGRATARRSA